MWVWWERGSEGAELAPAGHNGQRFCSLALRSARLGAEVCRLGCVDACAAWWVMAGAAGMVLLCEQTRFGMHSNRS